MKTRTLDVRLQRPGGALVARLTMEVPLPATMSYAGQQWLRTSSVDGIVYQADSPVVRRPEPPTPDPASLLINIARKRR